MASYLPVGLLTPASWVAMAAQRYLHETGATSEDLGRVAVADRKHAATNPKAWFYEQPITLEDHQNSRFIVEPLHLLDCCQETDGGQALVVNSLERARDLQTDPVHTLAAGYKSLGLTFTDATMRSVQHWAREHRPGSRGAHDYDLADYGLTPAGVRERFAAYLSTYAATA